jgi:hypothetical protein
MKNKNTIVSIDDHYLDVFFYMSTGRTASIDIRGWYKVRCYLVMLTSFVINIYVA